MKVAGFKYEDRTYANIYDLLSKEFPNVTFPPKPSLELINSYGVTVLVTNDESDSKAVRQSEGTEVKDE